MTSTLATLARWFDGRAMVPKRIAYRALGIGRDRLDELIETGEITYVKSGSRQLFTIEQLAAWLDSAASTGPIVKPGRGGKGRGRPCQSRNAAAPGTTNSGATVYDFEALRARQRGAKP